MSLVGLRVLVSNYNNSGNPTNNRHFNYVPMDRSRLCLSTNWLKIWGIGLRVSPKPLNPKPEVTQQLLRHSTRL